MNTLANNQQNNNIPRDIVTIIEVKDRFPFVVKVLKESAKYAQELGKFETAEEAIKLIESLDAIPLSPYRFQKVVSSY